MNELTVFNNAEFGQVRTVTMNGEPWFVGKDICIMFGDSDHKRSLSRIDREDKTMFPIKDSLGRSQNSIIINESGLYSLLFFMQPQKSNKKDEGAHTAPHVEERMDKLHKFKRWVTSEVLPSIRKTGSYSITQKQDSYLIEDRIERAKRWIEEAEYTRSLEVKNAELDADNKKLKPAATYAMDVLHHNKNLTAIDAVGRELGLNKNSMHKLLRDVGILCKCGSKYVLAAGHEDLGKGKKEYFLEKTYNQKGKSYSIPNDLAVSEKGRGYIMKHFDEWKVQAYGDKWREELWSKACLAEYHKSITDIM